MQGLSTFLLSLCPKRKMRKVDNLFSPKRKMRKVDNLFSVYKRKERI